MEMKRKRKSFSKQLVKLAIGEVESGLSRMEVSRKYGMAYVTICTWLKRYGNRELLDMRVKITDHQRRLIIRSIQEGRMTISQANLAYKIKGEGTIRRWLRDSKKSSIVDIDSNESMIPTSNTSVSQDLQHALHQANLKVLALETMIDVAEQQLNIKIRKKSGAKQ